MKTNKLSFLLIVVLTLTVVISSSAFAAPVAQTVDGTATQSDTFLADRLALMESRLNELVASGQLTQEVANQIMATHKARIEAQIANGDGFAYGYGRGFNNQNMAPGMGMQFRQNAGNRMGMKFRQNVGNRFQNPTPGMGMGAQGNGIQLRLRDGSGANCFENCPYYQNQPQGQPQNKP